MANGDAAAAAGMDVVLSTAKVNKGYDEINKTRDYIATRTSAVQPVANGGTGATTAAGARTNLGLGSAAVESTVPISKGGTGGTTAAGARGNLGVYDTGTIDGAFTSRDNAIAAKVAKSGDTMTGDLKVPNATAATSGYTIAYINGDGRLSKGASSERYKKFISKLDPATLGDIFPDLQRFQMRQGDGSWRFGYIAERLAENADQAAFVVYDADGRPDSIDFIGLLMAQNAQLNQRVTDLERRLS